MPIIVTCQCGKQYPVKDEYAGKAGRCPACGRVMRVSGPSPVSSEGPPPLSAAATPPATGEVFPSAEMSEPLPDSTTPPPLPAAITSGGAVSGDQPPASTVLHATPMDKSGLATTLAIIGLVLGALGFLVSLIPCVGWLGILGSGPAFVLSLVALISASTKHAPKGLAIAAVSVSAVGVSFPVLKLLLLAALLGGSSRISRPALNSLQEAINKNQALLGETDKKRKTVLQNALSKYPPPQFPMD